MIIEPTIGRVVYYYALRGDRPKAAIVTDVHGSRCVNLVIFDHEGFFNCRTSVTLVQPDDPYKAMARYCEWMPYQKEQASKKEALEKQLSEKS